MSVADPVKVLGETKVIVDPASRCNDKLPVKNSLMVALPEFAANRRVAEVEELFVIVPPWKGNEPVLVLPVVPVVVCE